MVKSDAGREVSAREARANFADLIGRVSGDVLAQLFSALNPFAAEEEFSNWECTVFAIDFESGLGDISGFLLQGEKIMVVGGGKVDLKTERLNIEFNTKPREGSPALASESMQKASFWRVDSQ